MLKDSSFENQIGSKASVDIGLLKDRISLELIEKLKEDPYGKIIDYKLTDGQGIGIVLEFADGSISWFFQEEILPLSNKTDSFLNNELKNLVLERKDKDPLFRGSHEILDLEMSYVHTETTIAYALNPMNFFNWLRYSLKDVI